MIAKCECQQCRQPIEFEAAELERSGETPYRVLGQSIDCPHCGKSTQLYLPRHAIASPKNPEVPKSDAKKVEAIMLFAAVALPLLTYAASAAGLFGVSEDFDAIIIGIVSLPLYFVPAIVGRNKKNAQAIFMLNLLAGWTFIGWVVAMVWACTKD